jgi:hypothetical protein|tara:strand:- start:1261 stop:2310 length:1050 start_codon:yes stop_codon:yes gene_type:complete
MAVNLNRVRNVQISKTQEAAYDSAATVDELIRVNADTLLTEVVEYDDDTDQIGSAEEAESQTVYAQRVELPLAQSKCKPNTLALVAGYALGAVATSAVGTNTYKHGFTPTTAHTTLASATMEVLLKAGTQYKYAGMFCDSFQLSISRGADRRVALTSQWYGSGTRTSGSVAASEQAESALDAKTSGAWLAATTYGATTGDALSVATSDLTAGTAIKTDVLSLSWQFNNNINLDFLYEVGSGLVFGLASRLARTQSLEVVLLFNDYTEVDWVLNQTALAFQWVVQGDEEDTTPSRYEGFNLIFPLLKARAAPLQNVDGRLAVALTSGVMQEATYGSVLLDVFTKKTGYLT